MFPTYVNNLFCYKYDLILTQLHLYLIPIADTLLQDLVRQGILDLGLDLAPQGSCPVFAVITFLGDMVLDCRGYFQSDRHLFFTAFDQILQEQGHDLADMVFVQRMEYDPAPGAGY